MLGIDLIFPLGNLTSLLLTKSVFSLHFSLSVAAMATPIDPSASLGSIRAGSREKSQSLDLDLAKVIKSNHVDEVLVRHTDVESQ